jgi:SAM-dependent methyltransferase
MPLDVRSLTAFAMAVAFAVPIFALLAITFIPIGQLVAWYLEQAPKGILSYTVNILASLAGILLYSSLCFACQAPPVWFAVGGFALLPLLLRVPRQASVAVATFAVCAGVVSWPDTRGAMEFWSPYQKLVLRPVHAEDGELDHYDLTTNNSWYQQIINLSPGFVASHQELLKGVPIEYNAYNLPYRFCPNPRDTLVLGAGMGNDVAAALRNGSGRVVAVEIDPMILSLGRQYHFEKPYDSPRVVPVVDDARSYVQNSTEHFDLIAFSLLDSHTTSSHFSNIRIDNYVYTLEALRAARELLKPEGVFVVKFQTNQLWIAGRLRALLTTVFGRPPVEFVADDSYTTGGSFYVCGSKEGIDAALADKKLAEFVRTHGPVPSEPARITTDDWPYFYQHEPGLPASVIVVSTLLLLLCVAALRRVGSGVRSTQWHFFFLGAGFMLMEVQIVSKMALLFGTTWLVNSIVLTGLLTLIVGANVLVATAGRVPVGLAYAGLFLSILIAYFIPVSALLLANPWARAVVATALLCMPVFFAGMVFIQSFAAARFSGTALGSNLLGALVGSLLEALSLWTGLRSLLILAALLYVLSWASRRRVELRGLAFACQNEAAPTRV